jgi:transposase
MVLGCLDGLVAKGYRSVDRDQQFLLPESMRDWLPPGDPVWLVISAVAELDTSVLHTRRRTGGKGRAGYDPEMLLTLLIWAWAAGVRSSRVIERLCQRDVAFRIICAGDGPDHVTISRFRAEAAPVMEQLFAQVLRLCARVGMARLGVVALDGVKIGANASLKANHTAEGLHRAAAEQTQIDAQRAAKLAAKAAAEHAATDAAEDELYGPGCRGDEVPPELVDERSRAARIAKALEEMAADPDQQAQRQAQLEAFRRRRENRANEPMGLPPAEIRVEILTQNLADVRARQQAKIDRYHARGQRGARPAAVEQAYRVRTVKAALDRAIAAANKNPTQGPPRRWPPGKRNITDPQSRAMKLHGGGWIQGSNCQAVTSSDGIIITTSVGNNLNDATAFITTMDKAVTAAALIDAHRRDDAAPAGIGILLADAGYLSAANLTAPGPDRLIAVGKSRAVSAAARERPTQGPPPPDATPVEAMAHRLRTAEGHAMYSQRSHIAETPFAHAKHNLGFRRFTSRGIARAAAEFNFHALVHNLMKAIGTGALAPAPA